MPGEGSTLITSRQRARHRQTVAAGTAPYIDEDVVRHQIRSKLFEERVEFAPGIGAESRGDGAPGVGLRAASSGKLRFARGDHLIVAARGCASDVCFHERYCRGIPRPRIAMMFFCISVVPPPTASPVCHRYCLSKRPSSGTYLERGSS